ncbi:PspC domain-containing protein [Corynebacterium freiburgense]|uniref:PspC domain-containing protein n=1 Tax=Corynebacterium freiburgense TaxID=556548 RepID=UPI00041101C9|nr:PspC domain-containing protein [Corynebacterium freiburgense]WJZ03907.1 PspC domain protein [Corynebacterium freiburgense]
MNQTLREMWETRPVRYPSKLGSSAPGAGICEGIGVRYQVDPTLIRILFVCAALFGPGIIVYLLCWLLMPSGPATISPGEAIFAKNTDKNPELVKARQHGWILICTLALFGAGFVTLSYSGLLTVVISLLIWWFLHSKQPIPPQQGTPMSGNTPSNSYDPFSAYTATRTTPPAWDPLGTAPFAWDLPEPRPVMETQLRKKHRVWPWIVIGGIIAAPVLLFASVIPLAAISDGGEIGNINQSISSPEDLKSEYRLDVGDINLDLSNLSQLPENRDVEVSITTGDITVKLPEEVPVQVSCDAQIGETECHTDASHVQGQGGTLNLKLHADIGSVKVQ